MNSRKDDDMPAFTIQEFKQWQEMQRFANGGSIELDLKDVPPEFFIDRLRNRGYKLTGTSREIIESVFNNAPNANRLFGDAIVQVLARMLDMHVGTAARYLESEARMILDALTLDPLPEEPTTQDPTSKTIDQI